MGLEEYHRKRDLAKTPEPAGQGAKASSALRFVIHKHAASHLHYDFRIEIDGVLKSWAIPKGPSLDPSVKRLAMMVEDHPYEYGDFEGVIPKGNYGAGEVIIWDTGTFHAAASEDRERSLELLREGLRKGDLKFILRGEKVSGEFALVRIKGEKGNSWLLIKKNDRFASTEDVTLQDRSVVSNATIEDLRAGRAPARRASGFEAPRALAAERAEPAQSDQSDRSEMAITAAPAEMPHQISPMLATSAAEPFDDPDWLFEIKLDGYRTVAELSGADVLIYSRNNLSFNRKFPSLVRSLAALNLNAVLDGEVVVLDESGRSYFQLLQNYQRTGRGNICYFPFDLLYLDGEDLRSQPLLARKERLRTLLPDLPDIRYSDHIMEYGREFFDLARRNNLEGILAKRATSTYQTGRRSRDWLKIKIRLQQEAVICGFTEPRRSRKGFGALVLGVYEDERLVCIGFAGGGFDDAGLKEMHDMLQPLVQAESPFNTPVKSDMPITWVKPELVCEVEFSEWTEENVMRQPIFLGLREDKDPRSVVRELVRSEFAPPPSAEPESSAAPLTVAPAPSKADDAPASAASRSAASHRKERSAGNGRNETLVLDGHRIDLTNLDKVFWPQEGYTKGDVVAYYRTVAHAMLPHLVDRPESLYRTPHGIAAPGFFQKETGDLPPSWIATREIYSKHVDKSIKFLICQDEATLIYMANLGCIEINPWLSRLQQLDYPDYFVIDLDPEDIPFAKVIDAALAVREVLEKAGAASFPKTSGATGIHIYVPLGGKYDYDTAGGFAKIVATLAHHKVPEFTSLVRSPKLRQKRVYLDFLQNKPGQTLAAPYSIRPRPGAPVSTPLKWEEVKPGLDPGLFTIRTMPGRLEKMGDLFAGVLGPGIDLERCIENLEGG